MTPLRQAMVKAMRQRGFSNRTHKSYLAAVQALAKYYHQSPDQLSSADLQRYFEYLVQQRSLSGATCRLYLNGIRFLYLQVLQWPTFDVAITIPKRKQRIPELLTTREVAQICCATRNLKHHTLLLVCYGCGLRVSELVALKVRDLDGERHLVRITQGKGGKDRLVIVSEGLLLALRAYYRRYHPGHWLFEGREPTQALSIQSAQRTFTTAKRRVGIEKIGGIHSLRHAYATHQLQSGMRIDQLQHQLGHRDIHSTLRYLHWIPDYREKQSAGNDLIADLEVEYD
jgi:site-specific recombinase XerD